MPLIDSEPFDSILLCFLVFSFPRLIYKYIYIFILDYIYTYIHIHTHYIKNWISARNELQRKCSLVMPTIRGRVPFDILRSSIVEWRNL